MSVDWPLRKLSDVCEFLNSKRIPLKSLDRIKRQGDFPYYGASGIVDHIDGYIFDGTYLLISEDGENLRTRNTPIAFKASGKFWVNNHAHILAEKEDGILDYLEYYFSKLDLSPYITGAVQPKLNKANLDSIEIPIPPIKTRLYINKVLNSFTSKVQLNRQTNQTFEQIAQALFKSWFVDFEPTRAKIAAKQAGQDPEQAAMVAISGKTVAELDQLDAAQLAQLETTAALFPDGLVESELGEVPEGWKAGVLANLCKLNEKSWTKKSQPKEVWYVDLANTKHGVVEEVHHFLWDDAPSRAKRVLQQGDTIVGTVRPGNRSFSFIGQTSETLTASTGFAVLTPLRPSLSEFVYLAATSDENIDRLAHLADGGAYPAVKPDVVVSLDMAIPTDDLIDIFSFYVKSLFEARSQNLAAEANLKALRDTLLPKLLSGELSPTQSEVA